MFSFFKKKKHNKVPSKYKDNNSICDDSSSQSSRFTLETQEGEISTKFKRAQTISAFNNHGSTKENNSSNSSTKSNSPQLLNLQQTVSCPPIQQKVFIEYAVQKEETLHDICLKFHMDKNFLMEINQIWEEDKVPKFLVVEATPIQQQIIRNHALKEETIKIIEKNTNLLGENKNNSPSNANQDEMEELKKKIAFFSNLEKNEDFPMKLVTDNGIINGTLIVNSFMIHFSPEMKDFKRLQNEIEHLKSKKAYKYHKFENNELSDYSITLDFNDIFLADINVIEAIQTQNSNVQKMQVKLDVFLTQAQNWSANSSNKSYLKVEFLSSETFEPINQNDNDNVGRTYVHYILQKVQYLIGKSRSHNEAINQFTDNFETQPSQSIVKHYQVVSCDSLLLMNTDSDSLFSTEQINPPRLQIYPSLIVGATFTPKDSTSPLAYHKILSQQQFEQIVDRLPCYIQNNDWHLIYCPIKHGFSYEQMIKKTQNIGPHVIVIRDAKHKYIFGAFVTEGWIKSTTSYGSAESFLFSFKKNPDSYQRKYQNILCYRNRSGSTQIQYCSNNGIAIGIDTKFALFIHYSLSKGTTHATRLMQNDLLTESSDFKISDFEIWGLDQSNLRSQTIQF
ncbi:hypothetical protein ABPG72_008573 [Tetrahymena utriculariae]